MKTYLLFFILLLSAASAGYAEPAAGEGLKKWDSEFSQAMNELEPVNVPMVASFDPLANPEIDSSMHEASEESLVSREKSDFLGRLLRLEVRIAQLEREQHNSDDRIRHIDRQISELKRKT